MRGLSPALFVFALGFLSLVQTGEGSLVGEVIARAPQGQRNSFTSTISNAVAKSSSRTGLSLQTASSQTPSSSQTVLPPQRDISPTIQSSSQAISMTSVSGIDTASQAPSPTAVSSPGPAGSINYSMEDTSDSSAPASQKTLVIVLSTILGSIGMLLVALVLFLVCRYRKRKAFKRGVSPINDEEIESWRNKERKQPLTSPSRGIINTVSGGRISPDWTWMTPGNVQSPPRALTRGPSLLAKAPNARVGLTTEVVPGDAAFIPIVKRQSSRLSKAQPGHIRTKSMRSSTSAKSMRSMNGGSVGVIDFTMSEEGVPNWHISESRRVESHTFSGMGTPSPATSVFVGLNEAGGLSPRPKSRQQESRKMDAPGWPIPWN